MAYKDTMIFTSTALNTASAEHPKWFLCEDYPTGSIHRTWKRMTTRGSTSVHDQKVKQAYVQGETFLFARDGIPQEAGFTARTPVRRP
jgi:hypothetical protein